MNYDIVTRDTIEQFLHAKYADGGPGGDRFEAVDDEVHSSQLSDCERKRKWKHDRPRKAESSPYFELGRVFELLYGAALAHRHDPDVTAAILADEQPWDVANMSKHVVQDVNVEIEVDAGTTIVGEADWVVMDKSCPAVTDPDRYGELDKVRLFDDTRHATFASGEDMEFNPDWVDRVVETKTKKDLEWVQRKGPDKKHIYQVYPYMKALGSNGEIAYMQRNDWEELVVELDFDDDVWLDCMMRARKHVRNQSAPEQEVPPTSPLNDSECRWCDYSDECRKIGGTRWSS